MKDKDLLFKLMPNLIKQCNQNYFKNGSESFTTYLWGKVDVSYCERLYGLWFKNTIMNSFVSFTV